MQKKKAPCKHCLEFSSDGARMLLSGSLEWPLRLVATLRISRSATAVLFYTSVPFVLVGFLRSGTKLLFRRRNRQKDPTFSQSHEDVSNLGNDSTSSSSASVRKKSGSFSRRLIKRFSFRSSKSKGKASATNGGAGVADNWGSAPGVRGCRQPVLKTESHITFSHLADAFVQSHVQGRVIGRKGKRGSVWAQAPVRKESVMSHFASAQCGLSKAWWAVSRISVPSTVDCLYQNRHGTGCLFRIAHLQFHSPSINRTSLNGEEANGLWETYWLLCPVYWDDKRSMKSQSNNVDLKGNLCGHEWLS